MAVRRLRGSIPGWSSTARESAGQYIPGHPVYGGARRAPAPLVTQLRRERMGAAVGRPTAGRVTGPSARPPLGSPGAGVGQLTGYTPGGAPAGGGARIPPANTVAARQNIMAPEVATPQREGDYQTSPQELDAAEEQARQIEKEVGSFKPGTSHEDMMRQSRNLSWLSAYRRAARGNMNAAEAARYAHDVMRGGLAHEGRPMSIPERAQRGAFVSEAQYAPYREAERQRRFRGLAATAQESQLRAGTAEAQSRAKLAEARPGQARRVFDASLQNLVVKNKLDANNAKLVMAQVKTAEHELETKPLERKRAYTLALKMIGVKASETEAKMVESLRRLLTDSKKMDVVLARVRAMHAKGGKDASDATKIIVGLLHVLERHGKESPAFITGALKTFLAAPQAGAATRAPAGTASRGGAPAFGTISPTR